MAWPDFTIGVDECPNYAPGFAHPAFIRGRITLDWAGRVRIMLVYSTKNADRFVPISEAILVTW